MTNANASPKPDAAVLYDAIVVGGGPAGLTAALYLARARYRVLVIERDRFGGQITITDEVVNYPGVLSASGTELTETMRRQAEGFGAEFMIAEVKGFDLDEELKVVDTSKGKLSCHAVLLATGANPRKVGFAGEEEFQGHGVAYCATCDGEFFTGKEVFVVGGGFAAAEEAVFLTKYARHVTILVRKDAFSCAAATAQEALDHDKIDVLFNTEVVEVSGDAALRKLVYRNNKTDEVTTYEPQNGDTFGVFVFVGYVPATQLVAGIAELDTSGYVVTDERQMTSVDGLFAAGDVCRKGLRQVATAVGQAAQAASDMERYIKAAQERTGLIPEKPGAASGDGDAAGGSAASGSAATDEIAGGGLFDESASAQLNAVFTKMERPVALRLHVDEGQASRELAEYMEALAGLTDKVTVEMVDPALDDTDELPFVEVVREDGTASGLAFHGVPGGHEFTSFVLGLYNVAGPGQPISEEDKAGIAAIERRVRIRVIVSLTCTMCPDLVVAAQRIAADNELVSADIYDVALFDSLKQEFNVMSVPCLVIDEDGRQEVSFGRRPLSELLAFIG